jgi:aerobic carbon-monoxide dehydrogenase medium subunit
VKPPPFDYRDPSTLEEAIALRAEVADDSAILAGGQSLVPMLNFRLARPGVLIDLGRISGLAYVRSGDGAIEVGAMTRQRDLELSEEGREGCPLVAETLRHVAHATIRNRGTVGGTLAHADGAAELPALLTALEGEVTVQSRRGVRTIAAHDLFLFHLTTSLEPDEILTEVRLPPLEPGTGYAFTEFARRHGDYALAGVCAVLRISDGRCEWARLAYSGVAPTPARAAEAEALLAGTAAADEALASAATAAEQVVSAPAGPQASQAYRRRLVRTLTERALRIARDRALAGAVA